MVMKTEDVDQQQKVGKPPSPRQFLGKIKSHRPEVVGNMR